MSTPLGCLQLTNSVACPQYATLSVGLGLSTAPAPFTDIASFDSWILNNYTNAASWASIATSSQRCVNSNYSGIQQRYVQSVQCYLMVDAATLNGCSTAPPAKPICKSVITTFLSTYNVDFGQASPACLQTSTPNPNPVSIYNLLASRAIGDTSCISGSNSDVKKCGFFNSVDAIAYCKVNPNIGCCGSSLFGGNQTDVNLLLPINTNSISNTTVSANTSGGGAGMGVIIGIVFAVLTFLAALILAIILVRKRKATFLQDIQYNESTSKSNYSNEKYSNNAPGISDAPVAETMQVIYNYVPNLSDEVYLYVGDPVLVKAKFDDGWALGYNMTTKQEGSFPLACVGPFNNGQRGAGQAEFGQRHSSLYVPSEQGGLRQSEYTTGGGVRQSEYTVDTQRQSEYQQNAFQNRY